MPGCIEVAVGFPSVNLILDFLQSVRIGFMQSPDHLFDVSRKWVQPMYKDICEWVISWLPVRYASQ